jgi:hypothetical protein
MIYTQAGGFMPQLQSFTAGPEWQKITLSLADFNTDGHDVTGIFIGSWLTPGKFTLAIDNLRLE